MQAHANRPACRAAALVGGGIGLLQALVLRAVAGGPWALLHRLNAAAYLPPMWLLGLLWLAAFILLGGAAGTAVACAAGHADEASAWRGCTAVTLAAMLAEAWYALLFLKYSLLFSWLCLPIAVVLLAVAALSWRSVHPGAALLSLGGALWFVFLLVLESMVILRV